MIILVDNISYAKRLATEDKAMYLECCDEKQLGEVRLFSDIGWTVVTTGRMAEYLLDENNIYYIHPEFKAKENFQNFLHRTHKMIEERRDLIDTTNTTEKLVFGITADGSKPTINSSSVIFSITKELKTGELFTRYKLPDFLTTREKVEALKAFEREALEHFGPARYRVEENDFYETVNFSSGKTVLEALAKFHMFIAVMEASL